MCVFTRQGSVGRRVGEAADDVRWKATFHDVRISRFALMLMTGRYKGRDERRNRRRRAGENDEINW